MLFGKLQQWDNKIHPFNKMSYDECMIYTLMHSVLVFIASSYFILCPRIVITTTNSMLHDSKFARIHHVWLCAEWIIQNTTLSNSLHIIKSDSRFHGCSRNKHACHSLVFFMVHTLHHTFNHGKSIYIGDSRERHAIARLSCYIYFLHRCKHINPSILGCNFILLKALLHLDNFRPFFLATHNDNAALPFNCNALWHFGHTFNNVSYREKYVRTGTGWGGGHDVVSSTTFIALLAPIGRRTSECCADTTDSADD